MNRYALERLQAKRQRLAGRSAVSRRRFIGIDPAKLKHQAWLLSPEGMPLGEAFSFGPSFEGFNHQLMRHLQKRLPELPRSDWAGRLTFAIETSCNLWPALAHFLQGQGFLVVLVSPLATKHARPRKTNDPDEPRAFGFSRTDPKDAYLVASCTRDGDYHLPQTHAPQAEAMHRLAITYHKLRFSRQQAYGRLRAHVELLFPELLQVVKLRSLSARHLLAHYVTAEEYLTLELGREAAALEAVSRGQHGRATLLKLKALARRTIGLPKRGEKLLAEHATRSAHLALLETVETQIEPVSQTLIQLARKRSCHAPLVSLTGVSDLMAALYVAELYEPEHFTHWKQIERHAGTNLYACDSGHFRGRRRITHLGNKRLRWVLFTMARETAKYVPEVRAKYLRRRLAGHKNRTKNLVACIPKVLQLTTQLVQEERPYAASPEAVDLVRASEAELEVRQQKRTTKRSPHQGQRQAA